MDFKLFIVVLLPTSFQVSDCLHYYKTPALDNQFSNFNITAPIPSDGINGSESIQEALSFNTYNRQYITFTFKGIGHALLRFLFKQKSFHFKVEIGGGTSHNEVSIYTGNTMSKKNSTTLINITSECEYRSFYIHKKTLTTTTRVYVGLGSDPRRNHVLYTDFIHPVIRGDIHYILISTANDSVGEWQFATAGQMFGGCGNDTVCHDNSINLECHNDNESKENGLIGTCTPEFVDFSSVTFASGYFRNAAQNTTESSHCVPYQRSGCLVTTVDRAFPILLFWYFLCLLREN